MPGNGGERNRGGGIEGEKAKIKGREERQSEGRRGTENDKKVNEREEEEEWGEERERVMRKRGLERKGGGEVGGGWGDCESCGNVLPRQERREQRE